MRYVNWARKGIIACVAAAGVIASSGLLHGAPQQWVVTGIAAAGAVAAVLVPNGPRPANGAKDGEV